MAKTYPHLFFVSSDLLIQMLKEKHDVYQGMKEQING